MFHSLPDARNTNMATAAAAISISISMLELNKRIKRGDVSNERVSSVLGLVL